MVNSIFEWWLYKPSPPHHPKICQQLSLFQHRIYRPLLLIRWIPILSKCSPHQYHQLGPRAFAYRPIYGSIGPHLISNFPRNISQGRITQHINRTIIYLQGIIKRYLIIGKPQLLTFKICFLNLARNLYQLLDDLSSRE